MRMAYIAAFVVASLSLNANRMRKPFNPLLGETFEYQDPKRRFQYSSEQVSHHPPISAIHCQGENFVAWSNSCIKSKFGTSSMEVQTLGKIHIQLLKTNEVFVFEPLPSSICSLLWGTPYIEISGELLIENKTTNEKCMLNFKKKDKKKEKEVEGSIFDASGAVAYQVSAKWTEFFSIKSPGEQSSTVIWSAKPEMNDASKQFFFNGFALQLNHLNYDLLRRIPATDSRLRPDQRAIELGENEFAIKEKKRLEEAQRVRMRNEGNHEKGYVPKYFEEKFEGGTSTFKSNQKYWEEKEKTEEKNDMFLKIFH